VKLTDILPIEKWAELEEDIHNRSGLDASVFNPEGISITDFKKWANRLCPAVKATDKGLSFICALANQTMANEVAKTRQPLIGECDAGLMKIVVPIFIGDKFLGVTAACGAILDHSEVESFLINKITEIDEARIESLSKDINRMPEDEAERLVQYMQGEIERIAGDFERNRK
jgi:ligand-binding sensor protein